MSREIKKINIYGTEIHEYSMKKMVSKNRFLDQTLY